MASGESKNDAAWRQLLAKFDLPARVRDNGYASISAAQMKEFREPRLMAKFDHRLQLPQPLAENRLALLPVSRGEYLLAPFDCFMPLLPATGGIVRMKLPPGLESIDAGALTSEAVAVNCALAAGIFADFLAEEKLVPTVSGRMGSGSFSFAVRDGASGRDVPVRVDNAQIEIDAALEGAKCLALIEAKCDLAADFIIRQLFYPYKTWENRIGKKLRLIYFVHSNGIFHLSEFAVADSRFYDSLRLIRSRRYSVEDTSLALADLDRVAESVSPEPEPPIPFPQADSFDRVVNLCELLLPNGGMTRDRITTNYDFDVRQTDYHTAAGRYLGLLRKEKADGIVRHFLTAEGEALLRLRYRERQLGFCGRILRHGVFREVYFLFRARGKMPDRGAIVEIMQRSGLYRVHGKKTYLRRASTVAGWVEWMAGLCPEKRLF